MSELALVIATNRPDAFCAWFNAWKTQLDGIKVYVVEDQPEKSDALKFLSTVKRWKHYAWDDVDRNLGSKSWIIPRRTSAIKSYGFMQARADGADYIWTLDDDCFPETKGNRAPYVHTLKHIMETSQADDSWFNTIESTGLYPRGYPYGIRQDKKPVMIHHGLWSGVPDLDGITALEHHERRLGPANGWEVVPTGKFFAMCGMNLVFRTEMTPAMYFGLQGQMVSKQQRLRELGEPEKLPFDRFDDIWAGLFAKKIADYLGYAVTSGGPSILHTKLSDPTMRVIKEGPGIAANEILWQVVRDFDLTCGSVRDCYDELALMVDSAAGDLPYPEYWKKLSDAMHEWAMMFNE